MKTANVLSEALQEILFVVLDIVSVAESADQFCSRALGCQTVQCNRSVFACPRDDLLGALAIPTIHRACEMAVGRINRKAAAGAAKQEAIFNAGFDQFVVWVSLYGLARFPSLIRCRTPPSHAAAMAAAAVNNRKRPRSRLKTFPTARNATLS